MTVLDVGVLNERATPQALEAFAGIAIRLDNLLTTPAMRGWLAVCDRKPVHLARTPLLRTFPDRGQATAGHAIPERHGGGRCAQRARLPASTRYSQSQARMTSRRQEHVRRFHSAPPAHESTPVHGGVAHCRASWSPRCTSPDPRRLARPERRTREMPSCAACCASRTPRATGAAGPRRAVAAPRRDRLPPRRTTAARADQRARGRSRNPASRRHALPAGPVRKMSSHPDRSS